MFLHHSIGCANNYIQGTDNRDPIYSLSFIASKIFGFCVSGNCDFVTSILKQKVVPNTFL